MFKKVLIGILAAVVVTAVIFSAFNAYASGAFTANVMASSNGGNGAGTQNGSGQGGAGRGNGGQGQAGAGAGQAQPQNGFTEWVTYSGTVSEYVAPNFNLQTTDGQIIAVQLGNLNYVNSLGLVIHDGDLVTVTGFVDPEGSLAVGQITLDASGQTFTMRGETGRPMWAGGGKSH